ncbi:MAG TPA: tRNA pseudouridine(55) synthase TruB [Bacillota bacterium]|nr:tRNA pseudouridine(55) synthase TruB [Bacillota bacterium]
MIRNDGDFMDGIIPLWKPKGMTSHDCVQQIRKIYNTRKVGHTGTLDPMVEGVLPICINRATKIVPYLTEMDKTYAAQVQLGIATETEDAHGEIIEEKAITTPPTLNEIDDVLQSFKGLITQIPPMYSAVRVKGKRLYEYARENKFVERPKRQVKIYNIHRTSELLKGKTAFNFRVHCSQGTYIRTLCVDIGKKLNYPAHMSHLIRVTASSFSQEETITFAQINEAKRTNNLEKTVVSMLRALQHMVKIEVDANIEQKISHGQKLKNFTHVMTSEPFLLVKDDHLLAIYQVDANNHNIIRPVRVFITNK